MLRSTLASVKKHTALAGRRPITTTFQPRYASISPAPPPSSGSLGFSSATAVLLGTVVGAVGLYIATPYLNITVKETGNVGSSKASIPIKYGTRENLSKALDCLRQVMPSEHVTIDEEELRRHGYSNSSYHNEGLPHVVVYPQNTDEVVQIMKIANEIPVIPFSGGTSLEGHYTAPHGGISVDFSYHMDHIVALHGEDMDVVVQPGVQWEDLNQYLKPHGLFFPLDPGPGACIGGMVGTGCSGTNAVRYGTMREWVLNLTVVMPDGTVVKTRQRPRKSSAGYDLTKLFIGSEGTLGMVTEATLKLAVLPAETSVAVCDFPTIRDAVDVSAAVVRAGVQVRALELLDDAMMKAINLANPKLGYVEKPTLFFKFSGSKAQIEDEIKTVGAIVKQHKGGKFKFARSEKDQQDLWEGRKVDFCQLPVSSSS
ncbi:hypothetical protein BC938DRAFT_479178 [Jimgerdemannia flammicorona]|uniref:D-lactate dehydrogenase (cytochrome) n=1 Tax=Jimgerdemannia flammicorona TaxID=994334 RepID=A0A433QY52_9FUNG|nr:hypothetical protein BC938DRAFT_479178 [Jimgerdemannia flammicorona]